MKLEIYRPLKTNQPTQLFGESKACINESTGKVIAKSGECPTGYIDLYESLGMKGHNGEDWNCYKGEPIYHAGNFEGVAKTEVDRSGGIGVNIVSKEQILQGNFIKLRYWHMEKVAVHDGQEVKTGDIIGYGDSTGWSAGHHLHWSLKKCTKEGRGLNADNGYYGAIDFRPYFNNSFVLDVINMKQQIENLTMLVRMLVSQVQQLFKKRNQ